MEIDASDVVHSMESISNPELDHSNNNSKRPCLRTRVTASPSTRKKSASSTPGPDVSE
jgi:hypothetical protein